MDFGFVALQMVTVSLPILLGWAARKLNYMNDGFDVQLSRLVLNFGLPCLILSSLSSAKTLPATDEMLWAMAGEAAMMIVALALAYLICWLLRAPASARPAYRFIVTFGNCGFIGFPVVTAVLGDHALLTAAICLIPMNFFIYTVGIMMFSGAEGGPRAVLRSALDCLKTPTLAASIVVVICVAFRFTEFGVVGKSITIVGQLTTPAALLLTGSSIAKYRPLEMLVNWRAHVAAAGRLLVAPLAGLAVLKLMPLDPVTLEIVLLVSSMPVATNGTLYSLQYGADTEPMMQGTFISILASIVTIPLVVTIAQM